MKKVLLAVIAVALTACSTIPNYRSLASMVVPTNISLVVNEYDDMKGVVTKEYCSATAITPTKVITAGHCIEAALAYNSPRSPFLEDGKIRLRLQDGTFVLAKIVVWASVEGTTETSRDVALLEVPADTKLNVARLGDSEAVQVGDQVAIVGNSYGYLYDSFSIGPVAFVNRKLDVGVFIQVQNESRGGNSGGGAFNDRGELIGTVVRSDRAGISFIVPLKDQFKHIQELLANVK